MAATIISQDEISSSIFITSGVSPAANGKLVVNDTDVTMYCETADDTLDANIKVYPNQAQMFAENNGNGDYTLLAVTSTSATIEKNSVVKNIATESAVSTDIVIAGVGTITITNGIVTAFTPE